MQSKTKLKLLAILLFSLALGLLLIHECSYGGGMGAVVRGCDCAGYEWLLYDGSAYDGPRKTICIGIVRSIECFQYIDGPAEECDFSSKVILNTDKQIYGIGESIELEITNKSISPIRYFDFCSVQFCQYKRGEWFCEIKDCFASLIVIPSGSSIVLTESGKDLAETRLKFRFEYQTFTDDALYTIDSNEFTIGQE